jgi:serine/threonine protein kinase/tetratricopeptide (TPR) repeat protein
VELLSADDQEGEGTRTSNQPNPRDIESTKARLFGEEASDHLRKQMAKARFLQALVQPSAGTETRDNREGVTQPMSPRELAVEPIRIGRYAVVRKLGEGGMGVVYAAYDEDLDRKVALKLLRGDLAKDERGRVRIRREAQALARLSHPNVVQVHEIGTWREHDFVAMEFVSGQTLDRWLRTKERQWTECLEVLLQAGRGLAAAHAADLVHRDFKPANVLVGDDGRVRVLDFGLARSAEELTTGHAIAELRQSEPDLDKSAARTASGTASGSVDGEASKDSESRGVTRGDSEPNAFGRELTATGALLGTWVYMAPEQHLGQRATAASDQFSFCFVLYLALFGKWPYEGESRSEHAACATQGRFEVPGTGTGMPLWLRKAVCRGLAPNPADRWPSMDALLAELSRDRASMWKRSVVAAGLVGSVGLALLVGQRASEPVQCEYDVATVIEGWTDDERAGVRTSFEVAGVGDEKLDRTIRELDAYANAIVAGHGDACEDHRITQVLTDAQYELRVACLDDRKLELRAAIDVLAGGDANVVRRAPEILAGLGDVGMCERVELLDRHEPAPKDEATARAIALVRSSLIEAHTARRAGRLQVAEDSARLAREQATRLDHLPLTGEVAQLEAEIAFAHLDFGTAKAKLLEALHAAEFSGDPERRFDAFFRLARVEMEIGQDPAVELEMADTLVERLGEPAPKRALMHFAYGDALRLAAEPSEARDQYDRAIELIERENFVGNEHLLASALVVRAVVGQALGDREQAVEDLERAVLLDPVHALHATFNLAVHELEARNLDRAEVLLLQALAGYERVYGPRYPQIGHGQLALAQIAIARGRFGEAEQLMASAAEVLAESEADLAHVLDAHASLHLQRGRVDEAIRMLERAVDASRGEPINQAYLRSRLGRALAEGGQYEQALAQLDQAIVALDGDPPKIDIVGALVDRGNILRDLGRLDRAIESLERAVELTPMTGGLPLQGAQARVGLALTLDALGRESQARDVALQAQTLVANTPDERETLAPILEMLSPPPSHD